MKQSLQFDKLVTLNPVDKTAALVIGKSNETYYTVKHGHNIYISPEPIRTKFFDGKKEHNITGNKYGYLKVVGYYGKGRRTALWVVECLCGRYDVFMAKGLKRGNVTKCSHCKNIEELREKK